MFHCNGCDQDLPDEAFAMMRRVAGGRNRQWKCRSCKAAHHQEKRKDVEWLAMTRLKARFRNTFCTFEEYEKRLSECEGRCEICGDDPDPLHIDHDHNKKRVRGLLCGPCNRGIGLFKDSPERLRSAADYIERTR